MKKLEQHLDKALDGRAEAGDELAELMEVGDLVERKLTSEVPDSERERRLFVAAVAARKRSLFASALIPAVAGAAAFVLLLAVVGSFARPGNALYPVRQALDAVGLTDPSSEEIDALLASARRDVINATARIPFDQEAAIDLATRAIEKIGRARALVEDYDGPGEGDIRSTLVLLEEGALDALEDALDEAEDAADEARDRAEERREERAERREDARDDREDNSGPASDNSGSGSDNSGSGSDNSGSGNSGSGSDNSGSGSSGSGSGNSGSGSGNSGSGSDNSGSG